MGEVSLFTGVGTGLTDDANEIRAKQRDGGAIWRANNFGILMKGATTF